jgi:hypothetical protein
VHAPTGMLLKNQTINGEIKASENNLGIISVRFVKKPQVAYNEEDNLVFSIKEKNQKTWLYKGNYRSGGINALPLYPFGFPQISNSKGKTYDFMITSQRGNKNNAVELSSSEPVIVSNYVYSKHDLFNDRKLLANYIYKKILNSFTDYEFLFNAIIYMLPFLFYVFGLVVFTKLKIEKYSFIFIIPLLIIFTVMWNIDLIDGIFYALIGFWVITILEYKLESSISFVFAALFFAIAIIAILFNQQDLGARFSNWTYIFLIIGVFQLIREIRYPNNKAFTYIMLINKILNK